MDLFRIRSLPFLTRRNYYYEFKQLLFWSMLAGLVEGQFASVVVAKTFDASETLIAIATATPVGALISSLIWGMLCMGRPKLRLTVLFGAGTVLMVAPLALIPISNAGAVWFVCQMAGAQVLLAGVVTVRSAIWRLNYPRRVRGRITARLQGIRFVVSVLTVLAAASVCDQHPSAFRIVFPVAAAIGLFSLWHLKDLRIRGERRELRNNGPRSTEVFDRAPLVEPFRIAALLSPSQVFGQMFTVLRRDKRFRRYCVAQLIMGLANLMTIAIVVAVVTRDLPLGPAADFWISTILIVALPRLAMLGSLRRWGQLFDRVGVVRFRVVNLCCWIASLACGLAATVLTISMAGDDMLVQVVGLFALRGLLNGLGQGGGAVAWHLGHLHFAPPKDAEVYMGIHVSLTGLRGLIAPLLGMWLWGRVGWLVWMMAIAMMLVSLWMFASMAREEARVGMPTAPGDICKL